MRLKFWKKKGSWSGSTFMHTLPKGRWLVETQITHDPKGNSQYVIIYKPAPKEPKRRQVEES